MGTKGIKSDFTNQQIGYLKVLREAGRANTSNHVVWECECICGKIIKVPSCRLTTTIKRGKPIKTPKSCGCISGSTKHSKTYTREFQTWSRMKGRCFNPNNAKYPIYQDFAEYCAHSVSLGADG
jgi:hypothetical protein